MATLVLTASSRFLNYEGWKILKCLCFLNPVTLPIKQWIYNSTENLFFFLQWFYVFCLSNQIMLHLLRNFIQAMIVCFLRCQYLSSSIQKQGLLRGLKTEFKGLSQNSLKQHLHSMCTLGDVDACRWPPDHTFRNIALEDKGLFLINEILRQLLKKTLLNCLTSVSKMCNQIIVVLQSCLGCLTVVLDAWCSMWERCNQCNQNRKHPAQNTPLHCNGLGTDLVGRASFSKAHPQLIDISSLTGLLSVSSRQPGKTLYLKVLHDYPVAIRWKHTTDSPKWYFM